MRKLTYYVATTLDGRIAGPDGGTDFFAVEGDHQAGLNEEFGDTVPEPWRGQLGLSGLTRFDTVLMGRSTYEAGLRTGSTSPYAHLRQYVFARGGGEPPHPDVEFVSGDALDKVRALKAEDGPLGIWLCGGGTLAAALLPEIDELVLKVQPVVLADGIPLFGGTFSPTAFTLTGTRTFTSGVVALTYAAARPSTSVATASARKQTARPNS